MNIVVTGGTRVNDQIKKDFSGYKITGTVSGIERTFPSMKCSVAGDPATFVK
jgi:hypothetical protein